MQKIDCKGNETNILDCSHEIGLKGSNYDYNYKNDHHEDDLAVVCYKGTSKMLSLLVTFMNCRATRTLI